MNIEVICGPNKKLVTNTLKIETNDKNQDK